MKPWRDQPPEGPDGEKLSELLRKAGEVPSWSPSARAQGWWRIADASSPKPRFRKFLVAVPIAAALALVGVCGGRAVLKGHEGMPPPITTDVTERLLPGGDVLQISSGAQYSVEDKGALARVVRLSTGSLKAQLQPREGGQELTVVTPQLSATFHATRFLVEVVDGRSSIVAFDGDVVVRTPKGGSLTAKMNERVSSDDPRLAAVHGSILGDLPSVKFRLPRQLNAQLPKTSCDGAAAREECLEKTSSGTGLAAQTALYALSLVRERDGADPRASLRAYEQRFPEGVFAPEVSLALIDAHARAGDRTAALTEASRFLSRFRADARAAEVSRWKTAYEAATEAQ